MKKAVVIYVLSHSSRSHCFLPGNLIFHLLIINCLQKIPRKMNTNVVETVAFKNGNFVACDKL